MNDKIEVQGIQILRLLSAFQAMDMTAKYGGSFYGASNRKACKIVEEITGIKPKGQGRGRIQPFKLGEGDALDRYVAWLVDTGQPTKLE